MTVRQMPGGPRGMVTTDFRGKRKAHRRLRIGMIVLAISALVPGVWGLFAPESFFNDFPGLGYSWVQVLPPYNEHLVRDVGAFFLGYGVLLGFAAWTLGRRMVLVSLLAWLTFAGPHLLFHLNHLEGLDGDEAFGQVATLALLVVLPLYLLVLARRSES